MRSYGKAYGWDILVFNGPDSYGESYFYRRITFVSGLAQSPALLSEWVTRRRFEGVGSAGDRAIEMAWTPEGHLSTSRAG